MRVVNRRSGRRRRLHRGTAVAEMALALSMLAFVMVASTDFARVFYYYLTITDCARNGAVYGCVSTAKSTDTSGIQAAALAEVSTWSTQPTVASTTGTDSGNPYVDVTVNYTFNTVVTYPGIPRPVSLSRKVRMQVAQTIPNVS